MSKILIYAATDECWRHYANTWNKPNTEDQILYDASYRTFLTITEYIFFSSSHRTFTTVNQTLGHKTYINKFKGLKPYKICFQTTMELN